MVATRIADLVIPENYGEYIAQEQTIKSNLIQSGALTLNGEINDLLSGGGAGSNIVSFNALADIDENISTDDPNSDSVPNSVGTAKEFVCALNRNQSWGEMDLAKALSGEDPLGFVASEIAGYWERRLQRLMLHQAVGIFADNDAAPTGTEHVQGDLTLATGAAFDKFSILDAIGLMGDSQGDLGLVLTHSAIYQEMRKLDLIDFIPPSDGGAELPFYQGKRVIYDDMMPNPAGAGSLATAAGIYHTYILGAGAFQYGQVVPEDSFETERKPSSGTGGGQSIVHSRVRWGLHPAGHTYTAVPADGGPSNADYANAANWQRVYGSRKQIKIARLVTTQ